MSVTNKCSLLFNWLHRQRVGGLLLFGFVTSWVFGREYSDRTIKDLMALPIPRTSTVFAKFLVILTWCSALCVMILILSVVVGFALGLPGLTGSLLNKSLERFVICSLLTILLCPPVAFFASVGKGYLSPLGFVVLTLIFAQIVAAAGAGSFFSWAVPALFSGAAGDGALSMPAMSTATVVLVCVLGCAGTALWWRYADQT